MNAGGNIYLELSAVENYSSVRGTWSGIGMIKFGPTKPAHLALTRACSLKLLVASMPRRVVVPVFLMVNE